MSDIATIRRLSIEGRHKEALQEAGKLLKVHPNAVPVLSAHAFVHSRANSFDIAAKSYRRLVKMVPDSFDFLFGLAVCHFQLGKLNQAEEDYIKLINKAPGEYKTHMNIGVLYRLKKQYQQSADHLKTAGELEPQNPEIFHNLGITLAEEEKYDDALKMYDHVLELSPDHYRALCNQGVVYSSLGMLDQAVEKLEASLAIKPDYHRALNNLGLAYLYKRDQEKAREVLFRYINMHPHDGNGYFNLSQIDGLSSDEIDDVSAQLEKLTTEVKTFQHLERGLFALGKFNETLKNPEKTEHFYRKGNKLASINRPFDKHKTKVEFSRIEKLTEQLKSRKPSQNDMPYIFIVGMPRSGTTLLESILATHEDIVAGDELPYLNSVCKRMFFENTEEASLPLEEKLSRISEYYLSRTHALFGGKARLIDKLPHNFQWAAVIASVFPKARILHCHRDPMDNCWSLYRANFEHGHAYCFSMGSLGAYYANYQKLMIHLEETTGTAMLSVNYDELVNDPSSQSKRIFEFLGISDFSYDETRRAQGYFSKTSSTAQVQRPISVASVRGWRRHEDFLQPLLHALQTQQRKNGLPVYSPD